ncbi:MAG: Hpt domain-containing protein [Pontixanthobacter sp.]
MLYETGSFDATLAAAAGADPVLVSELRLAFAESLNGHIDLLKRARCDGNWNVAAMRLRGLAASFNAVELIMLATEACEAVPGEPSIVRKIEQYHADFVIVAGG